MDEAKQALEKIKREAQDRLDSARWKADKEKEEKLDTARRNELEK